MDRSRVTKATNDMFLESKYESYNGRSEVSLYSGFSVVYVLRNTKNRMSPDIPADSHTPVDHLKAKQ
jgi:hypothetical protein